MGAAGFDYHVFNVVFRDNHKYQVVAFTVAQEQNMGTLDSSKVESKLRRYPSALSGPLYPDGIESIPESDISNFIKDNEVDEVVFAYSDISHVSLMNKSSMVLASGANFILISPKNVQLKSSKPVIAVCAVRTGVGKSSVSRKAVKYFTERGVKAVAIREPMPYGDLERQTCMRFAMHEDFITHSCTVEELEEYELYVDQGMVIYSGVDYADILAEAEKEADVIIWDGGNNEISFYKPDVLLVLADPLRRGHETTYHPGETNCHMADYFVIAKCQEDVLESDMAAVESNLRSIDSTVPFIRLRSVTTLYDPSQAAILTGKRAVVIEDGPTTTHGGMAYGAGRVMAMSLGMTIVDPRPHAVGSLKRIYSSFPHLDNIVPAMGYSAGQIQDLIDTVNNADADFVINGSPSDLNKVFGEGKLNKPMLRVGYDVEPAPSSKMELEEVFEAFAKAHHLLPEY